MISIGPEQFADHDAQLLVNRYFQELAGRLPSFDEAPPPASAYQPPEGQFLVARSDGVAVGCVALRFLDTRTVEIKHIWVDSSFRGSGVGRSLLTAAEVAARDADIDRIVLDSNDVLVEALSLYRSSGYHEIAPYNENPFAERWFEKQLSHR